MMKHKAISIRAFIGAKDFELSRNFYRDLGFQESVITSGMSYFQIGGLGFYLQNYYAKEWIENTMLFLEVEDVAQYWDNLLSLNLAAKYKGVKLTPIKTYDWGSECFMHDPSGVLWHFGAFVKKA